MPGFEWLGEEEKSAVAEVMDRKVLFRYEFANERKGIYTVREFEKAYADFAGCSHALAVTSGTAALKVALASLGIGPGDEVITQGFTFVATWESILDAGATPVFCEIDDTLCLDPLDLEAKITSKTRLIIPVHMMGASARIKEIMAVADKHGIPVLEDTAQSVGGTLEGKALGTFGRLGTLSFDPVKTLTCGEGGMVITNDEELYVRASEYHDHGHDHKPVGRGNEGRRFYGFNCRMTEMQGAIGLAQLAKLPKMLETQKQTKAALKEALKRIPGLSFRHVPDEKGDTATFVSWFMPDKDQAQRLAELLAKHGAAPVPWGVNTWHNYAHWEHLHAGSTVIDSGWPFKRPEGNLNYDPAALPRTTALLERCLSWQIMLGWDEDKLKQMTQAINQTVSEW